MERTSPIGLYNFGIAYLDTARAAFAAAEQPMFPDPLEFLCAHGLELIFKADVTRTQSLEQVRKKFGHNLLKLRESVSPNFLTKFPIDNQLDNVIRYLAIGHSGPNWRNRYIETGFKQALTVQQILPPLGQFNIDDRHWLVGHFESAGQ